MELNLEQRLLVDKAAGDCLDSQFELGRSHAFGVEGFCEDLEKAFFWLKKAASGGHRGAMGLLLGVLFEIDTEGRQERLFYRYVKKLSDGKDPMAMMDLGLIYCGAEGHFPLEKWPELRSYYNRERGFDLIWEAAGIASIEGIDLIPPHYYKSASDVIAEKTERVFRKELKLQNEKDIFDLLDMELMLMIRAHSGAQKSGGCAETVKEYDVKISEIRDKMERFYEARRAQEQQKQQEPINEAKEIYKRYGRM
jgi:TPR repeat protein